MANVSPILSIITLNVNGLKTLASRVDRIPDHESVLLHNGLGCCWQHQYPLWAQVQVVDFVLPIQLPVNMPGKALESKSSVWAPVPTQETRRKLLASIWLSSGFFVYWRSELVDGISFSLSLPFHSHTLPILWELCLFFF